MCISRRPKRRQLQEQRVMCANSAERSHSEEAQGKMCMILKWLMWICEVQKQWWEEVDLKNCLSCSRVSFSFSPALLSIHLLYHKLIHLDLSLSSCSQAKQWQLINKLSHRGIMRTGLILVILSKAWKFEQLIQSLWNNARNILWNCHYQLLV